MRTLRKSAVVCYLLVVAGLAACSLTPALKPPEVSVAAVRIDRIAGGRADATITLNVVNPNPFELSLAAAYANMRLEDVPFGVARLRSPLIVSASGSSTAELAVESDLASMLQIAAELARRLQEARGSVEAPSVRYAVTGTATLANGQSVPFARSGQIPFGRNRSAPP